MGKVLTKKKRKKKKRLTDYQEGEKKQIQKKKKILPVPIVMIHDPPSWQKKKDDSRIKLTKDSRQATKSRKEIPQNLSLFTFYVPCSPPVFPVINVMLITSSDLNTLYTIFKKWSYFNK